jgi:DNA-binding transcriptional LysR family regulator
MIFTMRDAHIRNLDLNLLQPLRALLEERHITRAAKLCYLSQPAMSRALERLRRMFGDPLLIRSGRIYERTVRGERLLQEVQSVILRLEEMVQGEQFDPSRSRERFRLALTDHASMIILPAIMNQIRAIAPNVRVETSVWNNRCYEDIAAGRLDTALSAEAAPSFLETEVLFNFDFVCLVGSAQRVPRRRLTLKQYLQLPHLLIDTWDGQQTLVDRPLAQLGVKRLVALSMPFFVPAVFAIAHTDLILTVPRKLAEITATVAGVRMIEAPREIQAFPYFMTWHSRVASESAHVWFRQLLRTAAESVRATRFSCKPKQGET